MPDQSWEYRFPMPERPTPATLAVIVVSATLNPDGSLNYVNDQGEIEARVQMSWWDDEFPLRLALIRLVYQFMLRTLIDTPGNKEGTESAEVQPG